MSKKWYALCLVACWMNVGSMAIGQHKEEFAKAQKDNAAALREYTWKSRTEIKMKGESKSVKLEQVRYDLDGKLEKTPIGAAPEEPPQPKQGRPGRRGERLKGKVVEKKKDEFAGLLQNLGQLVASYAHIPADKMEAFAKNAAVSSEPGGEVVIDGKNVLRAGDTMSVSVDPKNYMMRGVEIATSYEEKPVRFKGEFQPITSGPTYPARLVLEYPDKEVELTVENYDYQKIGQ